MLGQNGLTPPKQQAVIADSGDCGLYRPVSATGIICEVDFFLAIFL